MQTSQILKEQSYIRTSWAFKKPMINSTKTCAKKGDTFFSTQNIAYAVSSDNVCMLSEVKAIKKIFKITAMYRIKFTLECI